MTVMLCHWSCSRSNSIAVVMRPLSVVIRKSASGSDSGSMEYLWGEKTGNRRTGGLEDVRERASHFKSITHLNREACQMKVKPAHTHPAGTQNWETSKEIHIYLILLLRPVSGSMAATLPTTQAGGQFSDTSSRYRARENRGGSSAFRTVTRTIARSLNGPRLKNRESMFGFCTSTAREYVLRRS